MAILYRHIRIDKEEIFYIGIGETEFRAYNKDSRTKHWKNIAKKGYKVEILFIDLTWEQAIEKEKEFIKLYGRKDLGLGTLVNMTNGGEGTVGYKHTDISKEKTKIAATGINNPFYGKKRLDHSKRMQGNKNPCFGRIGNKHPMFGKSGYWKGKNRLDLAKSVIYDGKEFESRTALAKYLNRSKSFVTKILKNN